MTDDKWWESSPIVGNEPAPTASPDEWWKDSPVVSASPADVSSHSPKLPQTPSPNADLADEKTKPAEGYDFVYGKWRPPGWWQQQLSDMRKQETLRQYGEEGGLTHMARSVLSGGMFGWEPKAVGAIKGWWYGTPPEQEATSERQREDEFRRQHPAVDFAGKMAGGMSSFAAATPALEAAPVVGPGISAAGNAIDRVRQAYGWVPAAAASGAAIGAPIGALEAAGQDEPVGQGALTGALGGLIAGPAAEGVVRGVATGVAPWVSDYMIRRYANGGRETIGEMLASENPHAVGEGGGNAFGRLVKQAEDIGAGFPITGHQIRTAQTISKEVYNRDTINQVLQPIGEQLNADTPVGRPMIREMGDRIGAAYRSVEPNIRGMLDPPLRTTIQRIRNAVPRALQHDFDDTLDRILYSRVQPTNRLDGSDFRAVESELGQRAREIIGSSGSSFSERDLGRSLADVRDALFTMMARHSPASTTLQLQNINRAYSQLIPVEAAATAIGARGGVFSSAQLYNALRSTNQTARRRGIARGTANMQEDIEAAKDAMTKSVPDSGTPGRLELAGMATAL